MCFYSVVTFARITGGNFTGKRQEENASWQMVSVWGECNVVHVQKLRTVLFIFREVAAFIVPFALEFTIIVAEY